MRKRIALILLLFMGCNHADNLKLKQLHDSIAILKEKMDYKPMDSSEAYAFINKYYLPRLDSTKIGRRLFVYPLAARDFRSIFNDNVALLKAEYNNDTVFIKSPKNEFIPYQVLIDEHATWNNKRLLNTTLITDTLMQNRFNRWRHIEVDEIGPWHKKFGRGYVCISYPVYNSNTKRIYMREYIIYTIGMVDGNATDRNLWFKKVPGGWKEY